MNPESEALLSKIETESTCHAKGTMDFVREMLPEYAKVLELSEDEILRALESRRDYYAPNFYQRANFPHLAGVTIFATQAELLAAIPSKQFRCPHCGGVSTNPYECNSGLPLDTSIKPGILPDFPAYKKCDWKAYALFRTAGKGFRFAIKEGFLERPIVDEIFMPLEMETDKSSQALVTNCVKETD